MTTKVKLGLVLGMIVIVGGVMLVMTSSQSEKVEEAPTQETGVGETEVMEAKAPSPAAPAVKAPVVQAGKKSVAETKALLDKADVVFRDFPYKKDLEEYKKIHTKVFLTPEERNFRKDLLNNHRAIASMKDLLLVPATKPDQESMQNAALDLLLEGLQKSANSEAAQVLKDVVADSAVEDNKVDADIRKSLGGIKGEILYQWSSLYPQSQGDLERMLPGPSSQKIWANVKAQQESNLAESAFEAGK
ncbi:hypothetical protein QJS83_05505 [Bdellovibrio sp. 22V]|uniref:hypothetical protein n=1 Tax=Bdellovibrio sp. 22V TaxID=3044166 RepID=UPI002542A5AB|nr:hypothetical protein [Bdellovibrio sp. 22V]WII73325.1 hypothetical protein QJS83_05505 [Bdellovibrio sp. 22V]